LKVADDHEFYQALAYGKYILKFFVEEKIYIFTLYLKNIIISNQII
jgi:hypothetical protein